MPLERVHATLSIKSRLDEVLRILIISIIISQHLPWRRVQNVQKKIWAAEAHLPKHRALSWCGAWSVFTVCASLQMWNYVMINGYCLANDFGVYLAWVWARRQSLWGRQCQTHKRDPCDRNKKCLVGPGLHGYWLGCNVVSGISLMGTKCLTEEGTWSQNRAPMLLSCWDTYQRARR